jgi:hypothetical protein
MTEQEQIDLLKRAIATQTMEIQHIKDSLAVFTGSLSLPYAQPFCPDCGCQMYQGATCGRLASECAMGIGIK